MSCWSEKSLTEHIMISMVHWAWSGEGCVWDVGSGCSGLFCEAEVFNFQFDL